MRTDHLSLEHLSRYLSNKLSDREQDEVQEHLQQCLQCRKKLKEMRALHSGFFAEEKKEELHKKRFSYGLYIKVAASLVLLVGLSLFLHNTTHKDTGALTPHIPQQRELTNPVFSTDSISKKDTTHLIRKKIIYNEKDHHFDLRKKK